MKKRNNVKIDRIIILILSIILVVFVLAIAIKGIISITSNNSKENEINDVNKEDDKANVDVDGVTITINDYTVFVDSENDLGYNFIVADLTFKGNKTPLVYGLDKLQTKQKIYLDQVDSYINLLMSRGYDYNSLNIANEIRSDDSDTFEGKVFIPYSSINGELIVYNGEALKFDLSKNNIEVKTLKNTYDGNVQKIVENDNYKMYISDAYISDLMLHNNEEYNAGGVNVYTFKIHIDSITGNNVVIEKAKFIRDNDDEEYDALDKSYSSYKIDNIIGKPLSSNMDGALFFEVGNLSANINYVGTLRLKLSNSSSWIDIETTKMH